MLINLMVGILSQCMCMLNHHVVHFKYLTILFVNYTTSVRLQKSKSYFLHVNYCIDFAHI